MSLSLALVRLETAELRTAPSVEPGKTGLIALKQELDGQRQVSEDMTLGAAIEQPGARVHGEANLLMALPECIPLPFASLGAIRGVPLIGVSAHLAFYGESATLLSKAHNIRLDPSYLNQSMPCN